MIYLVKFSILKQSNEPLEYNKKSQIKRVFYLINFISYNMKEKLEILDEIPQIDADSGIDIKKVKIEPIEVPHD